MAFVGTVVALNCPTSVAAGTEVGVKHLMPEKSIQFSGMLTGTFSAATIQIQGSNDGSVWAQLGSDVTTNGIVSVTTPVAFLRLNVTSYTGGTPSVTLCGYGANYTP
jgi:hypothetical protein